MWQFWPGKTMSHYQISIVLHQISHSGVLNPLPCPRSTRPDIPSSLWGRDPSTSLQLCFRFPTTWGLGVPFELIPNTSLRTSCTLTTVSLGPSEVASWLNWNNEEKGSYLLWFNVNDNEVNSPIVSKQIERLLVNKSKEILKGKLGAAVVPANVLLGQQS